METVILEEYTQYESSKASFKWLNIQAAREQKCLLKCKKKDANTFHLLGCGSVSHTDFCLLINIEGSNITE